MTAPRRGQRPLVVDGVAYEWRIRKRPTYTQAVHSTPMVIAIQARAEGPRQVLVVNLIVSRPDNWIATHQTGITPAMVCDIVRRALDAGWSPLGGGPAFRLDHGVVQDSVGFRLPSPSRDPRSTGTPAASKKG